MRYIEYSFHIAPLQPASEILIAELSDKDFESFVETASGIKAYIPKEIWNANILNELHILKNPGFNITYHSEEIAPVNWNAEWEKNFDPIQVEECTIRAPFHPKPNTLFDIVITPKMSFGTGHHETTQMMVQFLLKEEIRNKKVLDMGCGTGILAILSEKRGAAHIDAIDIDRWCYENTLENTAKNECKKIAVYQGDVSLVKGKKYDTIIANINRNVLLEYIPEYAACLEKKGCLLLSGFYEEDMPLIANKCRENSLKFKESIKINGWLAVKYVN